LIERDDIVRFFVFPIENGGKSDIGNRWGSGIVDGYVQVMIFGSGNADETHFFSGESLDFLRLRRDELAHFLGIIPLNGGDQRI